ncbi:MAG: outer membrane beta-barrel protein [Candidatus Aminicenantes bacterium]|nr:outer membrane beta-barrel protein [Candidatus Aminicenantes bacterium]
MGKKRVFLYLTIFLFLYSVPNSHAEELQIRVVVDQANIRLKPDTNSLVISRVPLGAVIKALEKTGEWYHVNLPPDESGFVVSGYIHSSAVEEIVDEPVEKTIKKPETVPIPKKEVQRPPERYVPPPPPPPEKEDRPSLYEEPTGTRIGVGLRVGYGGSGIMFGGNFNFLLMKNLGICIEGLYFAKSEEGNSASLADGGLSKGKTTVIPLQLSIQGRFPVSPQLTPYISAGVGYYLNSFSLDSTFESSWNTLGFTIEETVDGALGFHGGAGLDFFLNPSMAVNLDARYIYLKPKGSWTITDQISTTSSSGDIGKINLSSISIGLGFKFFF